MNLGKALNTALLAALMAVFIILLAAVHMELVAWLAKVSLYLATEIMK